MLRAAGWPDQWPAPVGGASDGSAARLQVSWTRIDAMWTYRALACVAIVAVGVLVDGRLDAQSTIRTRVHASGFSQPVAFVQDPTDRLVQFVVEQGGRIRVLRDGVIQPADFLDVRASIS